MEEDDYLPWRGGLQKVDGRRGRERRTTDMMFGMRSDTSDGRHGS